MFISFNSAIPLPKLYLKEIIQDRDKSLWIIGLLISVIYYNKYWEQPKCSRLAK